MEPVTLHTMARRYLMSRNGKLHAEYATLPNEGRTLLGYTREARRIFPRYNVVDAMLEEVERLDPDDLPSLPQLAAALATAATTAQSAFTRSSKGIEADAISAERALFRESIKSWLRHDLVVEPLGYRRVLSDEESERWNRRLEERWGRERELWVPLIDGDVPKDVLVLQAQAMWDGPGIELVRGALRDMSLQRVIELRESGSPDSLLDLDLLEPTYTGAEGVWTDETLDWFIYASHHWTVEISGTLADRLKAGWPDIDDWRYVAPDWY